MYAYYENKVNLAVVSDKLTRVMNDVYVAGPLGTQQDIEALIKAGLKSVFNLQAPSEASYKDDSKLFEAAGVEYHKVPVVASALNDADLDKLLVQLDKAPRPVVISCASSNRASAVAVMHAATRTQTEVPEVARRASANLKFSSVPVLNQFVMGYVQRKLSINMQLPEVSQVDSDLFVGPQPTEAQLAELVQKHGIKSVLNIRDPTEAGSLGLGVLANESKIVEKLGLTYINIPTTSGQPVSAEKTQEIMAALEKLPKPVFMHCRTAKRSLDVEERIKAARRESLNQKDSKAEEKSVNPIVTCLPHMPTFTCTYIVQCPNTSRAALIDTVMDFKANSGKCDHAHAKTVLDFVKQKKLVVEYILETHVHADHLTGSQWLQHEVTASNAALGVTLVPKIAIGLNITKVQKTFAPLFNADKEMPMDGSQFNLLLNDEQRLKIGDLSLRVMSTPGHTPACCCFVVGDAVFTGDTLFMPDIGTARCDFPGGGADQMWTSCQRILALPPTTRMFVGHDYPTEKRQFTWETSVAEQKKSNKMVKDGITREEYIHMRTTRDSGLDVPNLLYPSLQVNMRAGHLPPAESNGQAYVKIPLKMVATSTAPAPAPAAAAAPAASAAAPAGGTCK